MQVSYRIIAHFACFKWKNYIILDFVVFVILISHRHETFSLTHVESTVHLYTTLVCELLVSKINDRESSFLGKHKLFFEPFSNVYYQVWSIVSNRDAHASEIFNTTA